MVDGEMRAQRTFEYTQWIMNWRPKESDQEVVEDQITEQEKSLRKRVGRKLWKPLRYLPGKALGINVLRLVEGEREKIDPANFRQSLPEPPAHLEQPLPARWWMVVAFSISLGIILIYLSVYLIDAFRQFVAVVLVYASAGRTLTEADARAFRETVIEAIEMLIEALPRVDFSSLRQLYPVIERIDFLYVVNVVSSVVESVHRYVLPVGIVATVVGFASIVGSLVSVSMAMRSTMREARRGSFDAREADMQEAEEYIGFHCVAIAISFFFGGFFTVLLSVAILLLREYYAEAWDIVRPLLQGGGTFALVEEVLAYTMGFTVYVGLTIFYPRTYLFYNIFGSVMSFTGVFFCLFRLVKFLLGFVFYFARFDVNAVPKGSVFSDSANQMYLSLVLVDNAHNNDIFLTAVASLQRQSCEHTPSRTAQLRFNASGKYPTSHMSVTWLRSSLVSLQTTPRKAS